MGDENLVAAKSSLCASVTVSHIILHFWPATQPFLNCFRRYWTSFGWKCSVFLLGIWTQDLFCQKRPLLHHHCISSPIILPRNKPIQSAVAKIVTHDFRRPGSLIWCSTSWPTLRRSLTSARSAEGPSVWPRTWGGSRVVLLKLSLLSSFQLELMQWLARWPPMGSQPCSFF